jgi:3-(3-hydroxy-phenyl)propionate hydroxylase
MANSYQYETFEYQKPPELSGKPGKTAPVAIIGAGPIGLAAAIDLAMRGVASVVLDDNNVVSVGSRAICWAKRTLEIYDRLGVADRMIEKGVTWKVGRLFHRDQQVYQFDLLPESGHKMPAFINLQQYYVEQYLVDRARDFPDLIDLRFKNKVLEHHQSDDLDHVSLTIETPDGQYTLDAQYLLACDGAGSATRTRMGLPFEGQTFEEQFLIIDIQMEQSPFESDEPERWFWFEPPFHQGQSALLHKQPDNVYRIDLQLAADADPQVERQEENVIKRVKAIVGDKPFKLDWTSVYKFTCAKLDRFVHGRLIFAGDSAHVVSPFGARGGNGGIQDIDNLCWKLARVLQGKADPALLNSYDEERRHGSEENILNSARATNFMTPKSPMERIFRDETLRLAAQHPFARKLVNSGRLSQPCSLSGKQLQTPSANDGPGLQPGDVCVDAPLTNQRKDWLLQLLSDSFTVLVIGDVSLPSQLRDTQHVALSVSESAELAQRYGENTAYLVRPDQHIAARFSNTVTQEQFDHALARASGVAA